MMCTRIGSKTCILSYGRVHPPFSMSIITLYMRSYVCREEVCFFQRFIVAIFAGGNADKLRKFAN